MSTHAHHRDVTSRTLSAIVAKRPASKRYMITADGDDSEPLTIADLVEAICVDGDRANAGGEDIEAIEQLALGDRYHGGGGAAPTWSVTRIA